MNIKIRTFYRFGVFKFYSVMVDGIRVASTEGDNLLLAQKIKNLLKNNQNLIDSDIKPVNILSDNDDINMKNTALNTIRASKGRFFGLTTTKNEVLNAQFRGETDKYITVYDRNNRRIRKFAKSSIKATNLS